MIKEDMEILRLIRKLRQNDIDVGLVGDDLEIYFEGDELPGGIVNEIRDNKSGIVNFLKQQQQPRDKDIQPVPFAFSYSVSSAQRRLWVLSQFEEGNVAYNIPGAYVFEGNLDVQALREAFHRLIDRHEILRTVFRMDNGGDIRQHVQDTRAMGFDLSFLDLREVAEKWEQARDLVQQEAITPFDLANGPLLRAHVLQLDDNQWVFHYCIHHIVTDGWSMGILINELLLFYNCIRRKIPVVVTPLRIQYKDYAAWQQLQLSGTAVESHLAYWLTRFSGELPVLELAGDRIRPAVRTYRGGAVSKRIDSHIHAKVKSLSQEHGASLFMVLLAAVKVLLYQYTGQLDIIVGCPIAGRDHKDLDDQIGFYLNILALRTQFSEDDTFVTLLGKVKEVSLGAYEHQVYPFDQLINALSIQRDMSRNALFDVMVVLQNTGRHLMTASTRAEGLTIREYQESTYPISKFDLTFDFVETSEGLQASIEYNSDIFSKEFASSMADRLGALLMSIAWNPTLPLCQLSMSTVEEQSRVLNEFNRPLEGRPVEATVAQCFEAQVSQSPTAVALVDEGVQYTYEQLHLRSNQVARHLRDICQVKAEDPVAIVLPRGEGMLTAMLGILKAGGAYVPIDPAYPRERIDYMLSDSRCKVVVDDALLATALNGQSHELLSVNDAGHLAYVIYTSGSTGKPKGVMVTHRNVVSFMENFPERFGLRPGMSIGAATNYTFDISVLELLCAVSCGLKVVLLPPSEPQAILTSVAEGQIDCLQVTPSRLTQLLTAAMGQIEALAKLKVLLVGGESLTPDHYDLLSSLPSTRVIHVYGPTETTIWSSSAEVSERVPLSLGTPLLRERIYVLRGDQLCPVGIAGEICISGSGVARGYLHRPEQTREKFVADPFVPGARLYRTGDMGRWNDRGQLIFLGRRDAQVKIRGYRIELGEVENALAGCAGVDAAVVQALPVNGEGLELVAYLVGTAPVDLPSVKEHLSRHLPGYMLPQHYVELPAMPLNASGKVDRRSLPSPQAARSARTVKYAPPRTETEERMVAIWQSILLQKDIGIHDDFFDIGGDSLKAIKLVATVSQAMLQHITLKDLYTNPTIMQLAMRIKEEASTIVPVLQTVANREKIAHVPEVLDEPIPELIRKGILPPLEGIAISYLQDAQPGERQFNPQTVYHDIFDEAPQIVIVHHTTWGKIGIALLPVFRSELYTQPQKVMMQLRKSMTLAQAVGARTVTLTGLLPSATGYGADLKPYLSERSDLPVVSTGHATTCAAVALNVEKALLLAKRQISSEHITFLGCGSIGINSLRMITSLDHPVAITLCDVPAKVKDLESIAEELRNVWNYRGRIDTVISRNNKLPEVVYDTRFFIGATNAPDILDIDKLAPGTIVIDDSAPHCFDKDKAVNRFETKGDILFTEGGRLKIPLARKESVFLPPHLKTLGIGVNEVYRAGDPNSIMGCVFSSVLAGVTPTIGAFDVAVSKQNHSKLKALNIEGADLHCGNYVLSPERVAQFAKTFGSPKKE